MWGLCGTVLLYCHCSLQHCWSWMSFVVISHDGIFNGKHVCAKVSDNWYLYKTLLRANQHTYIHKNAAGQDNKAGGLEFPMYVLTALHFSAFPVHTTIERQEWGRWVVSLLTVFLDLISMACSVVVIFFWHCGPYQKCRITNIVNQSKILITFSSRMKDYNDYTFSQGMNMYWSCLN